MMGIQVLTDSDLSGICGGWHPFPHGIFGRDGKPFFGKDAVKIVVGTVVKAGVSCIPGAAPFANVAGMIAQQIVKHNQ